MEVSGNNWDLAIVGGGPAGCAAGWQAAKLGLRVAIFERGNFPRDKVCGEFLSAQALPLLQDMTPELLAGAPEIARAVFVARGGARGGFTLPHAARGISRVRLDAALWRAAGDAGCTLFPETAVTSLAQLDARAVIVSAGRWWRISGLPSPPSADWVGVKARFRGMAADSAEKGSAPERAVEMYCFPGGYCGVTPIEDGLMNVCCLVHRSLVATATDFANWIRSASRHPALEDRLRGAAQASATITTAPVSLGARRASIGKVLLAGDACGFIDPWAGDGIARALLTGALAARSVARQFSYPQRVRAAAGRSYLLAGWMRALTRAPAVLQGAAVWALARPAFGPHLVNATRWRPQE